MTVTAEFTVEPFVPGSPGRHVLGAIDAARAAGATVDVGPFATSVQAESDETVLRAVEAALRAAITLGATRVSVQVDATVD